MIRYLIRGGSLVLLAASFALLIGGMVAATNAAPDDVAAFVNGFMAEIIGAAALIASIHIFIGSWTA